MVRLVPDLPIDGFTPFIHLECKLMNLGFHILDVGFQSRNSEASNPMVFVTTLFLSDRIIIMNATAIYIRNRFKFKYVGTRF